MSTRTIIEINHDRLHDLERNSNDVWQQLLRSLAMTVDEGDRAYYAQFGIRILGQRHHSEPEWVQGK